MIKDLLKLTPEGKCEKSKEISHADICGKRIQDERAMPKQKSRSLRVTGTE